MRISRVGYTRCGGCLSHVKVVDGTTACPFCGDELKSSDVLGGAIEKLRSSRATLIAMGLAGGVTFAVACGEGEGDNNKKSGADMGQVEEDMYESNPGNDYGGFDPYENNIVNNGVEVTDMGTTDDAGAADDAGSADAGDPDAG